MSTVLDTAPAPGAALSPRRHRWSAITLTAVSAYLAGTFAVAVAANPPGTGSTGSPAGDALMSLWLIPMLVGIGWLSIRRGPRLWRQGVVAAAVAVTTGAAALSMDSGNMGGAIVMGGLAGLSWYAAARGFAAAGRRWIGNRIGLLTGLAVGLVLAGINLLDPLLASQGVHPGPVGPSLFGALQPGLFEELTFHVMPLAVWLVLRRGLPTTRWGWVALYAFLILPHSAMHVPDLVLSDPGQALWQTFYAGVVFGIPLIALQIRRGALSAVTAHWAIDAVRFLVFGLS